jgi:hypothetical protein
MSRVLCFILQTREFLCTSLLLRLKVYRNMYINIHRPSVTVETNKEQKIINFRFPIIMQGRIAGKYKRTIKCEVVPVRN